MSTRRQRSRNQSPTVIRIQPIGSTTPPLPERRCLKSGKRVFETEEWARMQASAWAQQNKHAPGDAYQCDACGGWHLTSQMPAPEPEPTTPSRRRRRRPKR